MIRDDEIEREESCGQVDFAENPPIKHVSFCLSSLLSEMPSGQSRTTASVPLGRGGESREREEMGHGGGGAAAAGVGVGVGGAYGYDDDQMEYGGFGGFGDDISGEMMRIANVNRETPFLRNYCASTYRTIIFFLDFLQRGVGF